MVNDNTLNKNVIYIDNDNTLNNGTLYFNDEMGIFDKYLINDIQEAYKLVFQNLMRLNTDKQEDYRAILKFYANNYRYAVLAIEVNSVKEEVKNLNDLLK